MSTLPESRPFTGPAAVGPAILEGLWERLRSGVGRVRGRVSSAASGMRTLAEAGLESEWGRSALLALAVLAIPALVATVTLTYYVYFDRSDLPSLEAFVRFEPPTIGEVHGRAGQGADRAGAGVPAGGHLRRGTRTSCARPSWPPRTRISSPTAASTTARSLEWSGRPRSSTFAAWWKGSPGPRLRLPQGGSTLTQQLVRGYFLAETETRREGGNELLRDGLDPAAALRRPGRPRHQQALPQDRGGPPHALARRGARSPLRIARAGQAGDPRPLRELHLSGPQPLRLRRGLRVLLRQATGELHRGRTREGRPPRGDRQVSAGLRARGRRPSPAAPPRLDPGPDGPQRLHPGGPRAASPGRARSRRDASKHRRPRPRPRSRTCSTSWQRRREPLQRR